MMQASLICTSASNLVNSLC